MNYTVENKYTEETKGFLTECEAYNYMYEEIERLNNNCNDDCWSKEDFKLYKFDSEDCKYREIKIKVAQKRGIKMKIWYVWGINLPKIEIKANSFDNAIAQARKINKNYNTGQLK